MNYPEAVVIDVNVADIDDDDESIIYIDNVLEHNKDGDRVEYTSFCLMSFCSIILLIIVFIYLAGQN